MPQFLRVLEQILPWSKILLDLAFWDGGNSALGTWIY